MKTLLAGLRVLAAFGLLLLVAGTCLGIATFVASVAPEWLFIWVIGPGAALYLIWVLGWIARHPRP